MENYQPFIIIVKQTQIVQQGIGKHIYQQIGYTFVWKLAQFLLILRLQPALNAIHHAQIF